MTTACSECGAEILERTAAKTGGKCMPCAQGRRADIEESKSRRAEERDREAVNQAALKRLSKKERPTYKDFLKEKNPVDVLLQFLVGVAFRDGSENIELLTPGARGIYFALALDGEVVNGGFHQYFSNSSGQYAHETLAGLVEIGASRAAKLLQEAIRAFPSKRVPADWRERNDQLDEVDSTLLGELDDKYYALADDGTEDLASLIFAFMKRHAGEPVAA